MIASESIVAALVTKLKGLSLFDRVERCAIDGLEDVLKDLRDSSESIAIVIQGETAFEYEFEEGTNVPLNTDVRDAASLHFLGSNLERKAAGDDAEALPIKDQLIAELLWDDLGLANLITLPQVAEPVTVQWDNGSTRAGHKIDLQFRQLLSNSD